MGSTAFTREDYERILAADGNPYKILEISQDADEDEVKSAYKRLAFKTHPDKLRFEPKTSESDKRLHKSRATEAFKAISAAFVDMNNPAIRDKWKLKAKMSDPFDIYPRQSKSAKHPSSQMSTPTSTPSVHPGGKYSVYDGASRRADPPHHAQTSYSNMSVQPKTTSTNLAGPKRSFVHQSKSNSSLRRLDNTFQFSNQGSRTSQLSPSQQEPLWPNSGAGRLSKGLESSVQLRQDPFSMFNNIFGGVDMENDGHNANAMTTTANFDDPWSLFNSMFDLADTSSFAQDFIHQHADPLSPSSARSPPQRRGTEPDLSHTRGQGPLQQREPVQRSSSLIGQNDPFGSMNTMFNQLAGGMAGFDEFMSGEDPNRTGGVMTSRSQNQHMDRNGNLRQARQERSMGMMDMGMNGRMMMESSFTMQTFQSGSSRMSSQPQLSTMTGSNYSHGGHRSPGSSAPFSTPRSHSNGSNSVVGVSASNSPGLMYSNIGADTNRRTSSTFGLNIPPPVGGPSSSLGGYGSFRVKNTPLQSMY